MIAVDLDSIAVAADLERSQGSDVCTCPDLESYCGDDRTGDGEQYGNARGGGWGSGYLSGDMVGDGRGSAYGDGDGYGDGWFRGGGDGC